MKVDKYKVIGELIETNKRQFVIPVYQRNYDWKKENCKKLLDDVILASKKQRSHFLGSIVYVDMGEVDKIYRYLIIDGQQRITTIFLIMKALYDVCDNNNIRDEINSILFNTDRYNELNLSEQTKIKLKPIKTDNEQLLLLLNNDIKLMNKASQIYSNYDYLKRLIEATIKNEMSAKDILDGLKWLTAAVIVLKSEDGDDPQVVFESINSTGVPLSLADLIRNYVLMTDKNQELLFEKYWTKIEGNVGTYKMSSFFIDFLTVKTKEQVGLKNAYEVYRRYAEKSGKSNESLLEELLHYSNFYHCFLYGDDSYSEVVNRKLEGLRAIEQTTVFPFLLQVFDDYESGVIKNSDELDKIVSFLFNYHLRRLVCEIPSNSFKGLYKTLYNRVFSEENNKNKYYDAIVQFFSELNTKDSIPSDTEFKESLISKDIYHKKNACKYILKSVEETANDGSMSKEILKFDSLTIEHVMPQKLTDDWKEEIGANYEQVHSKYLHTLGNLTLTGYNSELGTKPFNEKKKILSEISHINYLNADIISSDTWNSGKISERADKLSSKILNIFAINFTNNKLKFSNKVSTKRTINSSEDLTGTSPESFILLGESVNVDSYSNLLISVITMLYETDQEIMENLAHIDFTIPNASKTYITYNPDLLRRPYEINNSGIFIESNLSSSNIISFIKAVLEAYQLDDSDFVFYINDEIKSYKSSDTNPYENASKETLNLYDNFKECVLHKFPELYIEEKKIYISFKRTRNVLDVVLLKRALKIFINVKKGTLYDPQNVALDCSEKGHWGNGDYYFDITDLANIEYILSLISQSFERN